MGKRGRSDGRIPEAAARMERFEAEPSLSQDEDAGDRSTRVGGCPEVNTDLRMRIAMDAAEVQNLTRTFWL
jgi:hypothetical protein